MDTKILVSKTKCPIMSMIANGHKNRPTFEDTFLVIIVPRESNFFSFAFFFAIFHSQTLSIFLKVFQKLHSKFFYGRHLHFFRNLKKN